jgi:hypothetical protein
MAFSWIWNWCNMQNNHCLSLVNCRVIHSKWHAHWEVNVKCRRGFDENKVCKNIQKGEELLDLFPQGNKEPIKWRTMLVEVAIIFEKGMWATLTMANPRVIGWVSCLIHQLEAYKKLSSCEQNSTTSWHPRHAKYLRVDI